MRDADAEAGQDVGLLLRWGVLVVALVIGGLLLSARAADGYTSIFGLLLAGFGLLIGYRLLVRVTP